MPYFGLATLIFRNTRSNRKDFALAKENLSIFIDLALDKKYTESLRIQSARLGCDVIQENLHRFTPSECAIFAQKILASFPDLANSYPFFEEVPLKA